MGTAPYENPSRYPIEWKLLIISLNTLAEPELTTASGTIVLPVLTTFFTALKPHCAFASVFSVPP